MPRVHVVKSQSNYLYAEFTTRLMGFVDDTEFYLDEKASVIHVRSASRLGMVITASTVSASKPSAQG